MCEQDLASIVVVSTLFLILVLLALAAHLITGIKGQDDKDGLYVLGFCIAGLLLISVISSLVYLHTYGYGRAIVEPGIHRIIDNINRKSLCQIKN